MIINYKIIKLWGNYMSTQAYCVKVMSMLENWRTREKKNKHLLSFLIKYF
jgi:hypothetical protein